MSVKKYRYNLACGTHTYEDWEVTAESVAEAVERVERESNDSHPEGSHRVTKIEEIEDLTPPVVKKRYALRVREDTLTARIVVRPKEPESDYWYDLENPDYLDRLARDFRRFTENGYELVNEDDLDDTESPWDAF